MFSRISAVPKAARLEPWLSMERVGESNSEASFGILEKCQHSSCEGKFAAVEAYFCNRRIFRRGALFNHHGLCGFVERWLVLHIVPLGEGCVHRVAEVCATRVGAR